MTKDGERVQRELVEFMPITWALYERRRRKTMLGERRRWRRGRDSNPRYGYPYAAFRVRCFQPLSHLSNR